MDLAALRTTGSDDLLDESREGGRESTIRSTEMRKLEKYPCHTQSMERCVKLVTEASVSVCGAEANDDFTMVIQAR